MRSKTVVQGVGETVSDPESDGRERGFIRECHGDLHLGNIVRWQGVLTPFDGIEFQSRFTLDRRDERTRVSHHGSGRSPSSGPRLAGLERLSEQTGDYPGLSVLSFYLVYRAVVRAKVDALRLRQHGLSKRETTAVD